MKEELSFSETSVFTRATDETRGVAALSIFDKDLLTSGDQCLHRMTVHPHSRCRHSWTPPESPFQGVWLNSRPRIGSQLTYFQSWRGYTWESAVDWIYYLYEVMGPHSFFYSLALNPQTKYTDWATTTCRRNLIPTFVDRGVSRGQRGGSPTVVNLSVLDRSRYFSFK
jgi:hypothetical protein